MESEVQETQSDRSAPWRGLHAATRGLFAMSLALGVSELFVLAFLAIKLFGRSGNAYLSEQFVSAVEGQAVLPFAGFLLTAVAGVALFIVLTLLQIRRNGLRSTIRPKGIALVLIALTIFYGAGSIGGYFHSRISWFREELAVSAVQVVLVGISILIFRGLANSYRAMSPAPRVKATNRTRLVALSVVASVASVGWVAYSISDVPPVNEAYETLAFEVGPPERWESATASPKELTCLADAGADKDGLWLIDNRFYPLSPEAEHPDPQLVHKLATAVKACVGVERYMADSIYGWNRVAGYIYDSDLVAECFLDVFNGPQWLNYFEAVSIGDSDESLRIVGLCQNVASEGVATFVERTRANLPEGFAVQPTPGFKTGLETVDKESAIAVSGALFQPDAPLMYGAKFSDSVASADDPDFLLTKAGLDAVFPNLADSERSQLHAALINRQDDVAIANKRICYWPEPRIAWVVNLTLRCDQITSS